MSGDLQEMRVFALGLLTIFLVTLADKIAVWQIPDPVAGSHWEIVTK